jgi:hypothetical protein
MIDFIELVVPVLQARGVYKRAYGEGTFREKIFGRGRARLRSPHPGAAYRNTAKAPDLSAQVSPA